MSTPLTSRPAWADELLDLCAQEATGRLLVRSAEGEEGWIEIRDGSLAGASAAGRRVLLGRRLTSFGVMSAADVSQILSSLRDRRGQRLLDVVLQDRLVPEDFVADFLRNSLAEQLGAMTGYRDATHHFESTTVPHVPVPVDPHDAVADALTGSHLFPDEMGDAAVRALSSGAADVPPVYQAVLAAADGRRRPVEIADECGLTVAEAVVALTDLRNRNLVDIVDRSLVGAWQIPGADPVPAAPPAGPAVTPFAAPPNPGSAVDFERNGFTLAPDLG